MWCLHQTLPLGTQGTLQKKSQKKCKRQRGWGCQGSKAYIRTGTDMNSHRLWQQAQSLYRSHLQLTKERSVSQWEFYWEYKPLLRASPAVDSTSPKKDPQGRFIFGGSLCHNVFCVFPQPRYRSFVYIFWFLVLWLYGITVYVNVRLYIYIFLVLFHWLFFSVSFCFSILVWGLLFFYLILLLFFRCLFSKVSELEMIWIEGGRNDLEEENHNLNILCGKSIFNKRKMQGKCFFWV